MKSVKNKHLYESSLGRWVGARILTDWQADLLVYGAENSDDFEYEQSYTGDFTSCVKKLKEYQRIIDKNDIDGYLTLASNRSDEYYEGDLDQILDDLVADGLLNEDDVYEESLHERRMTPPITDKEIERIIKSDNKGGKNNKKKKTISEDIYIDSMKTLANLKHS